MTDNHHWDNDYQYGDYIFYLSVLTLKKKLKTAKIIYATIRITEDDTYYVKVSKSAILNTINKLDNNIQTKARYKIDDDTTIFID